MTTIRSLGYRTDIQFLTFDGELHERDDYWVIRTPANPTFYWGNFLLFKRPPQLGDIERWRGYFEDEIQANYDAKVEHLAFGWDAPGGECGAIQDFVNAGFEPSRNVILSATEVFQPPKWNSDVEILPLQTESDWEALLEMEVLCFRGKQSVGGYKKFTSRQHERYRAMIAAGYGGWYGAFFDGTLVASLGLFNWDGLARFQSVCTHPDFRRRGLCSTLVYQAARHGVDDMGAEKLVMAADDAYHAAVIYESIGFRPTERQNGVHWWAKENGLP